MKLFYYKDSISNFGDDLNEWLWPRLLPDFLDRDGDSIFIGIGTILNERVPAAPFKVVFGSGVGYGRLPVVDDRWKIYCVRGPLSAAALGLQAKQGITDSAMLLRTVQLPQQEKIYPLSFMPHHETNRLISRFADLKALCAAEGINYINPSLSVDEVLRAIQSSSVLLAEAMHGAIVADALRVPWIALALSGNILKFKWDDWCRSVEIVYKPTTFAFDRHTPSISNCLKLIKRVSSARQPVLSSDHILDRVTSRLLEQLEQFKRDYSIDDRLKADSKINGRLNATPYLLQAVEEKV